MTEKHYYKLVNNETKEVLIAVGDDIDWFNSIGYDQYGNVETSYNGKWYLEGFAPQKTQEQIALENQEKAKAQRAKEVENIKVTVDGMVFDGDEVSQSRMARAITSAEAAGLNSTVWVLADNTVATVTKDQLHQALALSMQAMAELWTKPYDKGIALAKD